MLLQLINAEKEMYKEVEVLVGDYVEICEWDGITVKGVVKEVDGNSISVHAAKFCGGAYSSTVMDYSPYYDKSEFSFDVEDLYSIKVATFNEVGPTTLIRKALNQNHCGSEKLKDNSICSVSVAPAGIIAIALRIRDAIISRDSPFIVTSAFK